MLNRRFNNIMALSREDVLSGLCELAKDSQKAGIPLEDILECLDAVTETKHINGQSKPARCSYISFTLFKLFPALFLVLLLYFPVLRVFNSSACVLPSPGLLSDVMHPLANCSMCQGVKGAPRLVNLSRNEFMLRHAHSSRPIVVIRAASHWPAMEIFSYEYFRSLYRSHPDAIDSDTTEGQFFSYSSNVRNLRELFELTSERATMTTERWYIGWCTSNPHIGEKIRALISTPDFLPPSGRGNELAWIFMGAPGPGASMHIDSVGAPSWQAQLSGTKTWTLVPPVECDAVCDSFNVTVHRGDIIVVDTNRWYHQTFIHPGNISITIGSEYR